MPILLLLGIGAGAIVVAVAAASGGGGDAMGRRGPPVKAAGKAKVAGVLEKGQIGAWKCAKGDKLPLPQLSEILPAELVQSNVIATVIDTMIGIVKKIIDGLGYKWGCYVAGGKTYLLAQARGPQVSIEITAELGWAKRAKPCVRWTWKTANVSSDGELAEPDVAFVGDTGTSKSAVYNGHERSYLRFGGPPPFGAPSSACPTQCQSSNLQWVELPEGLLQPHVWVVRDGEDLRVWIYLPPRSGEYYQSGGAIPKWKRRDDTSWRVAYTVKRIGGA